MFFQLSAGFFMQILPVYMTIHYHYTPPQFAKFTLTISLAIIFSLYFIIPVLSKLRNFKIQIIVALSFCCAIFISEEIRWIFLHYIPPHSVYKIWVMAAIFYILAPIIRLAFSTLISESSENKGLMMGIIGQVSSASYCLSALLTGHLLAHHFVLAITALLLVFSLLSLLAYFYKETYSSSV